MESLEPSKRWTAKCWEKPKPHDEYAAHALDQGIDVADVRRAFDKGAEGVGRPRPVTRWEIQIASRMTARASTSASVRRVIVERGVPISSGKKVYDAELHVMFSRFTIHTRSPRFGRAWPRRSESASSSGTAPGSSRPSRRSALLRGSCRWGVVRAQLIAQLPGKLRFLSRTSKKSKIDRSDVQTLEGRSSSNAVAVKVGSRLAHRCGRRSVQPQGAPDVIVGREQGAQYGSSWTIIGVRAGVGPRARSGSERSRKSPQRALSRTALPCHRGVEDLVAIEKLVVRRSAQGKTHTHGPSGRKAFSWWTLLPPRARTQATRRWLRRGSRVDDRWVERVRTAHSFGGERRGHAR